MKPLSTQEKFKRGGAEAGRYFRYMSEFVGFTAEHAATIRETRFIIEKYIPTIVAGFYTQLLQFPNTRRQFEKKDGTIDQEGLQMRMVHQANFWRRAASGDYDDDFARYVDYVGRAHTSNGADPKIYIAERYVIGMVGFVQQRVTELLHEELHGIDHELVVRGTTAWNALLMVILEMLSRSYEHEREEETFEKMTTIDDEAVFNLAVDTYERSLGIARSIETKEVFVAPVAEIPDGKRKIIQVDDLSIGVFHHNSEWFALHNSCLHRGGPVCKGQLEQDTITCPWHGYQYNLPDGKLLLDNTATLPMYEVEIRGENVYLIIPKLVRDAVEVSLNGAEPAPSKSRAAPGTPHVPPLKKNEFAVEKIKEGEIKRVTVANEPVAIYYVEGEYFATHDQCTHVGGPLSEGTLDGHNIICPWHDSCFDIRSGEATCGPATKAVRTYRVVVEDEVGKVI